VEQGLLVGREVTVDWLEVRHMQEEQLGTAQELLVLRMQQELQLQEGEMRESRVPEA